MNVLSLFNGMSCGYMAFDVLGIKVDNYFSSEIDKYANQATNAMYDNVVHLGDITRWREWDLPEIDIIIGGSPCQGFSFAGKQLNLKDPRSKLFFDYIDILNHYKPKYFLLENVLMAKEHREVITDMLNVNPIMINSALVSAQNRKRLYWTNIGEFNSDLFSRKTSMMNQPEDKNIMLKDIIENGVIDRNKSHCLDASYYKGGDLKSYFEKKRRQLVFNKVQKDNMLRNDRPTSINLKAACLRSSKSSNIHDDSLLYRKLTPLECMRLQTIPEDKQEILLNDGISNTQLYKMLGNGWTIDVIAHIFSYIDPNQLLFK